mgnify:CR=1 FL=1
MSCSRERGHDHGSYLFISFLHMLFSSHSSSSSSSYSYSSSSSLFHLSLSLSPSLHLHLRQIVSPNPSSFSFVVLRFPYPYFLLVAVARHEVAQSYISDVFFFSSLLFSFFPHGTFLSLGRHGRTLNTTSFNCVHATISVWFSGKSLSSGFLLWILVFSAYSKEKSTRTT